MNALDEFLGGTLDIMLGRNAARGRGMDRIATSDAALRLSFFGVVLMVLIDACAHSLGYSARLEAGQVPDMGRFGYVTLSSIATFSSYLAFVFVLSLLCRMPQYAPRFNACLIVNNWANALVSAFFLPLAFAYAWIGGTGGFWVVVTLLSFGFVCVAGVRIMRDTMLVTTGVATGLFALIFATSIIVSGGMESLLGVAAR